MSDTDVNGRRRYDNSGRAQRAAATRRTVLDATRQVIVEQGYAGTTMTAVARAAGVSVETVYKGFGSKRELVGAMLGVAVAGDDEPVALAERPEMRALSGAASGADVLTQWAAFSVALFRRLGRLPAILLVAARAGEPELRDFAADIGAKRLADVATVIRAVAATGDLHPDLDEGRAADIAWTLGSPEVHLQLTEDRGWTAEEYERWLARSLRDTLLRR